VCISEGLSDMIQQLKVHGPLYEQPKSCVVTKTLDIETEAAGFETETEAKAVASKNEPRPRQHTSKPRHKAVGLYFF